MFAGKAGAYPSEAPFRDKRSSLLWKVVTYVRRKFYNTSPWSIWCRTKHFQESPSSSTDSGIASSSSASNIDVTKSKDGIGDVTRIEDDSGSSKAWRFYQYSKCEVCNPYPVTLVTIFIQLSTLMKQNFMKFNKILWNLTKFYET